MSDATSAVFLSYAREDTDAARRIADALRSQGVEVWFDQSELRGGDAWDAKIRKQINDCTLFLPIISQHTQARGKGYFRLEWKLAVEQTHLMAEGMAFLAPIVIDETTEGGALVPPEFMRVQWTRLPGALPTPAFVAQVKRLLSGKATLETGHSRPPQRDESDTSPNKKSGFPRWAWWALMAVIVGVAVLVVVSRRPAPAEKSAASPVANNPAPAAPAAPVISDKSIAVLPFENMSQEKDSAFFTDGIQEDILTNLALVRELRVVSRTSVMQYRGTTKPIRQIAQELGVAYVLEGSVRRAGNKVRVTGQLIHAGTDEHVWAKAYDRDLTDIFAIQSELSQAIAEALSAALTPQEKSLLDRRPTENLAAYDAYAKGRQLRQDVINSMEVIPDFEKAVKLDPKFAAAWAQLGAAHAQVYFNDIDRSSERLDQAKRAIDTAVRLAPDDPEVIEMLGDYYYYGYRDFARATEQYQRLAVLRPNDAAVFGSLGFIHRRQGRWKEALSELRRAVELEPRNLRYGRTLVQMLLGLNLFDEAAAVQGRICALLPDSGFDLGQMAIIPFLARGSTREVSVLIERGLASKTSDPLMLYGCKVLAQNIGDWGNAIKFDRLQRYYDGFNEAHWSQDVTAATVLWMHGDQAAGRDLAASAIPAGKAEVKQKPSPTAWVTLGAAYAMLGDKAEAMRCAKKAMEFIPESQDAVSGPPFSLNYVQMLAWTGDKDGALLELARLLRTPFGENIYAARISAGWWPLHGDPRFEKLVNDPANNGPLF